MRGAVLMWPLVRSIGTALLAYALACGGCGTREAAPRATRATATQATAAQVTATQVTAAQVTDTQGTDTQGTDTQGTDTQGTDTQGTDTQGTDTQGTDTQGTAAEVERARGESALSASRRDLGRLPRELAGLRWPEAPRIERTVEVDTGFALQRAVDAPRTRVRVVAPIDDAVTVHASDVEIVIATRGRLGRVNIEPGVRRVRITGGAIESIELLPPARWSPEPQWDEALVITDVTLDHLVVRAADTAFAIRGRRVAVLDNDVRAERYSLWAGDTGPLDGSDLVVAGNALRSAGPEATLRMHDVVRSVVVDNVLSNGRKHDYRVHGRSDLAYASRNVLLRTGVMIGNQPGDAVGTVIFEGNTIYLEEPSMFEVDFDAIRRLVARDNVVYTDRWERFWGYPSVREGWVVERNERHPFRRYEGPTRIAR